MSSAPTPNIEIIETNAYRNDVTGGWRLAIRFKRQDDKKPVELRAFLRNGGTTLSETWSYILPAELNAVPAVADVLLRYLARAAAVR